MAAAFAFGQDRGTIYQAVEHRHYYSDLHATILHQLGLDYTKMEHEAMGRTFRLVEQGGGPIKEIIA